MRKIVMFNLISLDGFFAGPNGEIDWHNAGGDEFNEFAIEQLQEFGTIIFGRVTYKVFEEFWPKVIDNPKFSKDDQKIAKIIDNIEKIVFSRTLKKVTWNNSKLLKEIDPDEINRMKKTKGKDMVIFGSGEIVQIMTKLGLIDEYRILMNPIILGKGKSLFKDVNKLDLKLLKTREFRSGNVLLTYQPMEKK